MSHSFFWRLFYISQKDYLMRDSQSSILQKVSKSCVPKQMSPNARLCGLWHLHWNAETQVLALGVSLLQLELLGCIVGLMSCILTCQVLWCLQIPLLDTADEVFLKGQWFWTGFFLHWLPSLGHALLCLTSGRWKWYGVDSHSDIVLKPASAYKASQIPDLQAAGSYVFMRTHFDPLFPFPYILLSEREIANIGHQPWKEGSCWKKINAIDSANDPVINPDADRKLCVRIFCL